MFDNAQIYNEDSSLLYKVCEIILNDQFGILELHFFKFLTSPNNCLKEEGK